MVCLHVTRHCFECDQIKGRWSVALKAVSIGRVSSDKQEGGYSPEEQHRQNREFIKKHGYDLLETFHDSVSGKDSIWNRTKLLEALVMLDQGRVDLVVFNKPDRIGRGAVSDDILRAIYSKGGKVGITNKDRIYPDYHSAKDDLKVELFIADFELGQIHNRTRVGKEAAVRNGAVMGSLPYGYKIGREPRLIDAERGIYKDIPVPVIDERASTWVKYTFVSTPV